MRSLVRMNFVPGTEEARAALLPAEQAHVKTLIEQGIVETGYLAADGSCAWMVVQGESREHTQQVLSALPFYPFMEPEVTPLRDIVPGGSSAPNADRPTPREGVAG